MFALTRGPKENRTRPAVDPLFRSAAQAFCSRVIGVILTGELDDGNAGLSPLKAQGGTTIVQDPIDALAPSMPLSALRNVSVDYRLPLNEIAPLLLKLTAAAAADEKGSIPVPDRLETEVSIAKEANAIEAGIMKLGGPSIYCPTFTVDLGQQFSFD